MERTPAGGPRGEVGPQANVDRVVLTVRGVTDDGDACTKVTCRPDRYLLQERQVDGETEQHQITQVLSGHGPLPLIKQR